MVVVNVRITPDEEENSLSIIYKKNIMTIFVAGVLTVSLAAAVVILSLL